MTDLSAGRIVYEIVPFFHYRRLRRRFMEAGTGEADPAEAAEYERLSEDELTALLKEERQRGASMDEKTFKLTLAVTFGLTVMSAASTPLFAGVDPGPLRVTLTVLLLLVVVYALAAGFVALGAMRTLPSYGLGTYPELKNKSGARRAFFASSLARNEKIGLARHARNETAYTSLRNSFICLFAAVVIFLLIKSAPVGLALKEWCACGTVTTAPGPPAENDGAPR